MIQDLQLKRPYIAVELPDGTVTYGGDQSWLNTEAERAFGCGLIAAADILRYLRRNNVGAGERDADRQMPGKQEYLEDIRRLTTDFRVRGSLGITGFGLAMRMNRVFRREKLPYRAKWSIGRSRLIRRLSEMLAADIPVLLSVGPGFFHRDQRLPLYQRTEKGEYEKANSMRDHYVTVTGSFSDGMLRISSWGIEYYIRLSEYLEHVRAYDNFLFSSVLYIKGKNDHGRGKESNGG